MVGFFGVNLNAEPRNRSLASSPTLCHSQTQGSAADPIRLPSVHGDYNVAFKSPYEASLASQPGPSLRPQYAKATQTKGNMINRQKVPCFVVANAHQTLNILGAGFRRRLEGANGGEHSANTLISHKMHFLQNIDRYGRALRSEKAPGKDSGKDNFRARRLNGAAGGSGGMGYDSLYFNLLIFRKHKFSPVCGFPIRFSPPTPSPV